jgi:asparagine synthase (glutamine-hydrolysing)
MCGIAGKFNFDAARPIDPGRLAAMTSVIAHRGPDADGFHVGRGIGLGHRRLSIIDLVSGSQPLANEDGSIWVVFNGEIYNFEELRDELVARGHVFRTKSDTEVIVHGYEEWGDRAVERFRGMFAFAIWDEPRRRLLLARDRVGVKPLYYAALDGEGVVFGSEIKAILEDPEVPREWSAEAIDAYLSLLYVPAPATVYKAINKLPPAHILVAERGQVSVRRYWDLTFAGDGDASREAEYLEALDATLSEAVKLRLISDVPVGAFLSGGIDSSAVVAYMVENSDSEVVTTSVGFNEAAFDELQHAEQVARHLGCAFHPQIANPNVETLLPKLAWHFDEPFGDASAVPTYYVSQAARKLVTVALSGDGGDELWAGYGRHRFQREESRVRRSLGAGAAVAGMVAGALPLSVTGVRSLRRLSLSEDASYANKHARHLFEPHAKADLYSTDFAAAVGGSDPFDSLRSAWRACPSADPVDRALSVDFRTYLPDDIMTKVDRMSMAVSLEAREPLLDHRLLELSARIPSTLKLKNGTTKYLLRRLLERRVPRAIVERRKQGFDAPSGEWLRGPLNRLAGDLLTDGRLESRGLFRPQAIERMWHGHRNGTADHRQRIWQLVMLELWFRTFVDGDRSRPAAPALAVAQGVGSAV